MASNGASRGAANLGHQQATSTRKASAAHILIVDPSAFSRRLLVWFLSRRYRVTTCGTSTEALRILNRTGVQAVVTEYRLPDGDGLTMLDSIKKRWDKLPVILMTAHGSENVCADAFRRGVADYVVKPCDLAVLEMAIRRLVKDRRPSLPNAAAGPRQRALGWRLVAPIEGAVATIRERYWDNLSLVGLAQQAGMSSSRFSRMFHALMGVSFRRYLVEVRVKRAKDLLANPDNSITDIAQMVGFGDLPRFDKVFKRETRMTPRRYRRQLTPWDPPSLT